MDRLDNIEELIRIIEAALLDIRLQLKMIVQEEKEVEKIIDKKNDEIEEVLR